MFVVFSFIPLPMQTFRGRHPEAEKQIAPIGRELARPSAGTDQKNFYHVSTSQSDSPKGQHRFVIELLN